MNDERPQTKLGHEESLRLLGTVPVGRIVFTQRALPAIHPVRHIIDEGDLILRSAAAPSVPSVAHAAGGAVVAYQADSIDPKTFTGWSVVVTGLAQLICDVPELARYQQRLSPWTVAETDHVIRIKPELINGFRLGAAPPAAQ
jgi:Pyridoxamine 5'-phosphate oxidase